MPFFRVRQYGAFWLQRSHCGDGYHISPPTGLNLESAEISTSKLANSKQQMSKSIQQGTLGTLWWGLRAWHDATTTSAGVSENFSDRKKKRFFGHCFFGPRLPDNGPKKSWLSGWLAVWLAIWLSGWLAGSLSSWLAIWLTRWLRWLFGNWLCGCLASYLAISYPAGWLIGRLALAIWLALWMARSLACYLAI